MSWTQNHSKSNPWPLTNFFRSPDNSVKNNNKCSTENVSFYQCRECKALAWACEFTYCPMTIWPRLVGNQLPYAGRIECVSGVGVNRKNKWEYDAQHLIRDSVPNLDIPSRTSDFFIANLAIFATQTTHNWFGILTKTLQSDKLTVRYQTGWKSDFPNGDLMVFQ